MKKFGRLAVSVASDVADDSMRVILHESDYPLLEGVIKGERASNERTVMFLTSEGERAYPFEEVRRALVGFIEQMIETHNVTIEDVMRDSDLRRRLRCFQYAGEAGSFGAGGSLSVQYFPKRHC